MLRGLFVAKQPTVLDGLAFDPFSFQQDGLTAPRPQRCEDRKAPVGGFAKHGVEPLPGFDHVLNGAILVIRRELDTVPRGANLDALSTPPDARRYHPKWS